VTLKHVTYQEFNVIKAIIFIPVVARLFSEKIKYARSSLEAEELILLKDNLSNYMTGKERYLDSKLNIVDLSEELNIFSKYYPK